MNVQTALRGAIIAGLLSAALNARAAVAWYNASWTNRIAVTIDYTKVSGHQTNFPVLINLTNASLQAAALASGNDILFTSADGTTKLDHEIESYTNSNGALVAWVEVPILSSTANTILYLYYGNSASTNQQNVAAVWNANFKGVWHLKESSGSFNDSTANGNHGADNVSATGKTGKIGSGQQFDGLDDYINAGTFDPSTGNLTVSFWARWNGANGRHQTLIAKRDTWSGTDMRWQIARDVSGADLRFNHASATALFNVDVPDATTWHLYVVTRTGTSCRLYKDGVAYGSAPTMASYATDTTAKVLIGGVADGTEGWNGYFDEVRIANSAHSAAWIATEFTNQNSFATFYSVGSAETVPSVPPTKLAITSVNSGANPTAGTAFTVVVQAQDSGGTPQNVISNTAVALSLNTGSGILGGTLTATITAGTSSVTISGVTYNQAESGVVVTATRTSGDSLTTANSSAFTVNGVVAWYNASWANRIAVTIDYTKVSGHQTNFPVLINLTNASLQAAALASGNDLLFTSGDGTTKLDHEIESYTNSNGALVAWVEVPMLSSTVDTTLYLYYGNASSTNQQNVAGTWNSNFKGVWHLNGVLTDSTANSFNGVNTGTIAATGKISNGRGFVPSNGADKITITGEMGSPANVTLSAWVNLLAKDTGGAEFISIGDQATVRQDNAGVVGFFHDGTTWNTTPSSTNLIGTGWHYVAYTFDDAGNSQKVYVNGVQIASSTFTASISYAGQGANTIIGGHANGNTSFDFDGTLDEVRVANAARSAGWVATEYNNQNSPATFYSVSSAESAGPTKLAITSINGGSNPTASTAFSVVVQAQNAGGASGNVTNDTAVTVSLNTGTGTLGGTLTGTITAGTSSVTISGVTYSKAETGVILTATRTSGASLTAGNSSAFTVFGVVTAAQSTVNASPTSVVGNGIAASTITVTLKDVDSSPVAGKTVTLAKSGGSSIISPASGTSSASGVVTFTVTDTVAETTTYTATDTTDSITITQTADVTFTSIPWYNTAWTNRIAVTIDYTKVSGHQTNFPVLINLTNASLQASALASGNDILFTSADGTTKLDHEIESYTNSNGALVAWVKVPILSSTVDTTLYLYYGNSFATNQQNATGVWDANFKGVWHLKEDSAGSGNLSLYRDSTTNNNNADDLVASTNKSGRIAGGQGFNGSSDTIKAANSASLTITQRITLSAWINYTAFAADNAYANIVGKGYDGANEGYYLRTQRSPSGSPNTLIVGSFTGSPSFTDHNTSWTISGWNTNEWHHIVGLYDGSNWKLYFDGVEKATSTNGTGAKANARPVTIGAWDNNGTLSRYSNMRIDECRISADSRSAGWIATEYNNQNSPATFASVGSAESAPPTRLAITSINSGSAPTVGAVFNVVVQAQDAGGTPRNVTAATAVTLSRHTGSGPLGGTLTGTITAGNSSVTISGVTYGKAENGVILTATRTSGDSLTAGNSSSFNVSTVGLTVSSGLTANNKIYDGTATATISSNNVVLAGVLAADVGNVSLSTNSYTAAFSSATVGNGKTVTVSGLTLTGSAAGNYTLTQPSLTANVTAASTGNAVTSSLNPAAPGLNITFTATLSVVSPGAGTPTGNVTFKDGTTALGTTALNGSGVATFSTSSLSHGAHLITAEYAGDANFLGSTNTLSPNQTINTAPTTTGDTWQRYPTIGAKGRVTTLLANDADADGDALTLSSVSAVSAAGATIIATNDWVVYLRPDGFTNSDSFSYVVTDGGLQATGSVAVTIVTDLAPSENVVATEDLGNGDFRPRFLGIPGRTYTIQYTTNLVTPVWQSVGTAAAAATGTFEFTDSPPPASPTRYYRSTYP